MSFKWCLFLEPFVCSLQSVFRSFVQPRALVALNVQVAAFVAHIRKLCINILCACESHNVMKARLCWEVSPMISTGFVCRYESMSGTPFVYT